MAYWYGIWRACFLYVKRVRIIRWLRISSIYLWNHRAKNFLSRQFNLKAGTAPVELNSWELEELGIQEMELVVYGYLPVMVSAGCVRKNTIRLYRKARGTLS